MHTTNRKEDFMIFYPHKCTLDLAAGTKTDIEEFGHILVRFPPNEPLTQFALVFYCPNAQHATLSPPALQLLNNVPHVCHLR